MSFFWSTTSSSWHILISLMMVIHNSIGTYLGDEDSLVSRVNKEVILEDTPSCWLCVDVGRTRAVSPTLLCLRHGCPQQVCIPFISFYHPFFLLIHLRGSVYNISILTRLISKLTYNVIRLHCTHQYCLVEFRVKTSWTGMLKEEILKRHSGSL